MAAEWLVLLLAGGEVSIMQASLFVFFSPLQGSFSPSHYAFENEIHILKLTPSIDFLLLDVDARLSAKSLSLLRVV